MRTPNFFCIATMTEQVGIYCMLCARKIRDFRFRIMDVCEKCMDKQCIRYIATVQCTYQNDGSYCTPSTENERCSELFQQEFTLNDLYPTVFATFVCQRHPKIIQRIPVDSSQLVRMQLPHH